jgi:regulator of protease activity HflC (stomatin/prohibitin superfamily)
MSTIVGGCTTVPPGHVGVVSHWGVVQEEVWPEGLHWGWFGIDVNMISVQTQTVSMTGNGCLKAPASDQVVMNVDISISYHVNEAKAPEIFRFFPDYQESIIIPAVRAGAYNAVGQFEGQEAASTKRQDVAKLMSKLVIDEINKVVNARFEAPAKGKAHIQCFIVDNVALRKIALPAEIQQSIAAVQIERQNTAKAAQALKTQQEQNKALAEEENGRAERAKIRAESAAEVALIRSKSLAEFNKLISPSLSPAVLRRQEILAQQAILESDQTRTIILGAGGGKGPTPLLSLP